MNTQDARGFTLVEVLIASTLFAIVLIAVTQIFSDALALQKRSAGYQAMQDTAMVVFEGIAREVRVSTVTSPAGCATSLTMDHPVHGELEYTYDVNAKQLTQTKNGATSTITPANVWITNMSFCSAGNGLDNSPTRVTIPMTLQSADGENVSASTISLQTTIISRDSTEELSN